MKVRTSISYTVALLAIGLPGLAAQGSQTHRSDPLSGAWNVTFLVPGYPPTPATFALAVDGERVTGTIQSDHTGPGKITEGVWKDGKLSFTAVFEKHEAIAITGSIENGKLGGEFRTEGFVAKWEGSRAAPTKSPGA
jgi:hypothetical protein